MPNSKSSDDENDGVKVKVIPTPRSVVRHDLPGGCAGGAGNAEKYDGTGDVLLPFDGDII